MFSIFCCDVRPNTPHCFLWDTISPGGRGTLACTLEGHSLEGALLEGALLMGALLEGSLEEDSPEGEAKREKEVDPLLGRVDRIENAPPMPRQSYS